MSSDAGGRSDAFTSAEAISAVLRDDTDPFRGSTRAAVVVWIAYTMLGWLGYVLSAPGAGAAPVWPAAGAAFVGVLLVGRKALPAVALGSIVATALAFGFPTGTAALSALGVGVGVAAQAALAVWLVGRFVAEPRQLLEVRDSVLFLFFAGPIACLLNASWGPLVQRACGVTDAGSALFEHVAWWTGDVLGVLVVAPLALAFLGRPARCWRIRAARVGLPMLLAVGAAAVDFEQLRIAADQQSRADAELVLQNSLMVLTSEVDHVVETVHGLASYFAGSERVERGEFAAFVSHPLERLEALHGLLRIELVDEADQAAFESRLAAERPGFEPGSMERERTGGTASIVLFAEPEHRVSALIGEDVRRDPGLSAALSAAVPSGQSLSSSSASFLDEGGFRWIVVPAPGPDGALSGWVAGIVHLDSLVGRGIRPGGGWELCLTDLDTNHTVGNCEGKEAHVFASVDVVIVDRPFRAQLHDPHGAQFRRVHGSLARSQLVSVMLLFGLASFLMSLTARNISLSVETELRRSVEERLNALTTELQLSNKELEDFAYMASHDLRAPLRAIKSLAEWIAEDSAEDLSEEAGEYLALLQSRVLRLDRMIDGLLQFSRAGRRRYPVEPVDVDALVAETVDLLGLPAGFTVDAGPMPKVVGQRVALGQVFHNLIGNAAKHHEGSTGRITLRARRVGKFVEFSIADDGPGIPVDQRERIFEAFTTLKSRDQVEGSGMGLATVKRLIDAEGGAIRVLSNEPRGTRMVFTWPAVVNHTEN